MESVCRTCLTLGDLSPIFPNQKQHTLYTSVLLLTTGLKIELNDGLPQSICQGCTNLINSALKLRDQSHHAQQILLENGFQKSVHLRVDSDNKTIKAKEEPTEEAVHDRLSETGANLGANAIGNDKIKVEIDLNIAAALIESDSKKTSAIVEAVALNCKRNPTKKVKEKPAKKKDYVKTEENVRSDDSKTMEDTKVKIENNSSDVSDVIESMNKRKYVRKKVEEPANAETEVKTKRKYVRKSEQERLEAKAKKGARLTRQQTVDKYRHMMETEYVPKRPLQCRVCKKQFARLSTFIPHVKRHLIGEYVCEQCGRRFHTRHSLSEHGMRLHGAERVLRCEHCDYRAIDQYQLKNHLHKVHTGQRPFVCDLCGAAFYCKSNVRQHMRKHLTTKNVQCDRCPAMFKSRSSLASHTSKCHRMNFAYLCYLCPRRYTGRCAVRTHLTKQHGVPRHLQGPVPMRKWGKDEPPPPDIDYRITS